MKCPMLKRNLKVTLRSFFFERTEKGNIITVLPIGKDGRFTCDLPDSYGDFFVDEELKMLEI